MNERRTLPRVAVLQGPGVNCDRETVQAFNMGGGNASLVHLDTLRRREELLSNFQIVAIPGGFSWGDHFGSGRMMALYLQKHLSEQIDDFINHRGLVFGECNGFQVLTSSGLLPGGSLGTVEAALRPNNSGKFECRPVHLRVENDNACVFMETLRGQVVTFNVAHGEGQLHMDPQTLAAVQEQNQVVMRYCTPEGIATNDPQYNPNGSIDHIAALTDPSGRIFGLMPHPTTGIEPWHNPNYRRGEVSQGLPIFQKMVEYAAQM